MRYAARDPLPADLSGLAHSLGRLGECACSFCGALLFRGEKLKCCFNGGVHLPPVRLPQEIKDLIGISATPSPLKELFLRNICALNGNFQMVVVVGSVHQDVFQEISFIPRFGTRGFRHFSGSATVMVKGGYFHCVVRAQEELAAAIARWKRIAPRGTRPKFSGHLAMR